jgi:hypothetical protein
MMRTSRNGHDNVRGNLTEWQQLQTKWDDMIKNPRKTKERNNNRNTKEGVVRVRLSPNPKEPSSLLPHDQTWPKAETKKNIERKFI